MNVDAMNRSSAKCHRKSKPMKCRQFSWLLMRSFAASLCSLLFLSAPTLADESKEPAAPERWTVIVDDTPLDRMKADSPHRYKLQLYEMAGKENRLVLERDVSDASSGQVQKIVLATMQKFELPPLDKDRKTVAPDGKPSSIAIVIHQHTKLRDLVVRFNREQATRLGVQKEIKQLIEIVNEELRATKSAHQIRLPAEE